MLSQYMKQHAKLSAVSQYFKVLMYSEFSSADKMR